MCAKRNESSLGISALLLTVSKVLSFCISLVSLMILSRVRTLEEYGTYSQLLMCTQLVVTVVLLGLPNSINYFLARASTEEEKRDFLSQYFTVVTILSLVSGWILYLCIPGIELYFSNNSIHCFAYFLLFYPWTKIVTENIENLLIVFNKSSFLLIYRLSHSLVSLVVIFFIEIMSWGFETYVIMFLLVEVAYTFFVYGIANWLGKGIKIYLKWEWLKTVLVFSLPLGLASSVGTLHSELDKLLIGFLFSTEELALYTNASKSLPITFISTSLTTVLLPQIAKEIKKDKIDKAVDLWKTTIKISFFINVFFSIGLVVFAEEAIVFLYSEKYIAATSIFAIYSCSYALRCTYYGMVLNSMGQSKYILKVSIMSLILNMVLNVAFYHMFGFSGPALATLISTMIEAGYMIITTARIINISVRDIFPWPSMFKYFGVNIALGCVFLSLKIVNKTFGQINQIAFAFLAAIVWFICYFIICKSDMLTELKKLKNESVD